MNDDKKISNAIQAARMYFYQNLTTEVIAKEMNVSRSTLQTYEIFSLFHLQK